MLQYDTTAFVYFLISILSCYLIPSYYKIIKTFYKHFNQRVTLPKGLASPVIKDGSSTNNKNGLVRTSLEKNKAEIIMKKSKDMSTIFTTGFNINLAITGILTLLLIYGLMNLQTSADIQKFDPYSILAIDPSATMKQIKQAYRKKSLVFHPDKNPDNPKAEAMFMMIAKAYESLTDEAARENYLKYGNPDGKQSLEVSIGLPTFLLSQNHRLSILLCYLFIMVVIIPTIVYFYYTNSAKYGEKDIMYKTWGWFNHSLSGQQMHIGLMPEVLAGCAEFHEYLSKNTDAKTEADGINEDKKELGRLTGVMKEKMVRPRYNHILVVKGNILLHSHLMRVPTTLESFKNAQYALLQGTPRLLEAMISHCAQKGALGPAINVILFSQHIVQALWLRDPTILQIPHLGQKEIQEIVTPSNDPQKPSPKNLVEYLKVPNDEKKGLAELTSEQKADVFAACKMLPQLDVEIITGVEDDEDAKIYNGDLITVSINVTRLNLEEGEKVGSVHAPHWPLERSEGWWICLCTKDEKIISLEKVVDNNRTFTHKVRFMAPPVGKYNMDVFVLSNSYVGLDKKEGMSFEVIDASLLPAFEAHKDDLGLDDDPTLFEQMMQAANEQEDEDSDSDDDTQKKVAQKKDATAEAKKAIMKKGGDDSDSDSDCSDTDDSDSEEEAKKTK